MKKLGVLEKYGQLEDELNRQHSVLKRTINDIAEKNIKDEKVDDASFYTNKKSTLENVEKIKYALRESEIFKKLEENNINKNDVFLFSKVAEDVTYDLQLSILSSASTALGAVDALNERAEGEESFAQKRREKIDEFCLYVNAVDIANLQNKNDIINDIFAADSKYFEQYLSVPIEKIDDSKSDLLKLYRNALKNIEDYSEIDPDDIPFAGFIFNIAYYRCKKISDVFSKYGIRNYVIAKNVQNAAVANKSVGDIINNKRRKIKEEIPSSIQQKFKIKEIMRTIRLILAITIVVICMPYMDEIKKLLQRNEVLNVYADTILNVLCPLLLANLVIAIILRAITNKQKESAENKEFELWYDLSNEFFDKKYYKMISSLTNDYYALCKKDYFDKSEKMIVEMSQLKTLLKEEVANCSQLIFNLYNNYLPDGLLENKCLLELIIKIMREGKANNYKEARNLAEKIMQKTT